jgi:predicted dehydrogenase
MTIRWGVAGTGGIAQRFGEAMTMVEGGQIVAVASRSDEGSQVYGERFGVARRHGSYEALAGDPEVDAVYVATPNHRHEPDTLAFLAAGKHVLCEKPLALDSAQAARMVEVARERGLFLMEAIWSRFLPAYRILADLLVERRIGDIRLVEASFGFAMPVDPAHRLFDPALGGGALLDLGVYPLQLCSLALGPPDRVVADGHVGDTGVDEQAAAVLHHPTGALGVAEVAIRTNLANTARIIGERGAIELPAFMHCPDHLVVSTHRGVERIDASWDGDGLRFQVDEVHRCLAAGLTESPVVSADESLCLAATTDALRAQLGLAVSTGEG